MPDFAQVTREDLVVGDYIAGRDGQVWKVTRAAWKEDGRYLGVESPGRDPVIVLADSTPVTRITYGAPTEEQAVATVAEVLGGEVLAESTWGPDDTVSYFHPPLSGLHDNIDLLRAHLVRFHGERPGKRLELDDLTDLHVDRHAQGADHDHGE